MSKSNKQTIEKIKARITGYQDFPKPGVFFRNIFPVLRDPEIFRCLNELILDNVKSKTIQVDVVVALDSRGFLFGPILAQELNCSFVPVRKAGKLPGETVSINYSLEYGQDKLEIEKDSIKPCDKIVIIDDVLATGGTMKAVCDLLAQVSGDVVLCLVVIEKQYLKGRDNVPKPITSIIQY